MTISEKHCGKKINCSLYFKKLSAAEASESVSMGKRDYITNLQQMTFVKSDLTNGNSINESVIIFK